MTQFRTFNYREDDSTFLLNKKLLSIIPHGRYAGYDGVLGDSMNLVLSQENGATETELDSNQTKTFGILQTRQGVTVREDADVQLLISLGDAVNPRYDIIVARHEFNETNGGSLLQYLVVSGTPASEPLVPSVNNDKTDFVIGVLFVPANTTQLDQSGVKYEKSQKPFIGNTELIALLGRDNIFSKMVQTSKGGAVIDETAIVLSESSSYYYLTGTPSGIPPDNLISINESIFDNGIADGTTFKIENSTGINITFSGDISTKYLSNIGALNGELTVKPFEVIEFKKGPSGFEIIGGSFQTRLIRDNINKLQNTLEEKKGVVTRTDDATNTYSVLNFDVGNYFVAASTLFVDNPIFALQFPNRTPEYGTKIRVRFKTEALLQAANGTNLFLDKFGFGLPVRVQIRENDVCEFTWDSVEVTTGDFQDRWILTDLPITVSEQIIEGLVGCEQAPIPEIASTKNLFQLIFTRLCTLLEQTAVTDFRFRATIETEYPIVGQIQIDYNDIVASQNITNQFDLISRLKFDQYGNPPQFFDNANMFTGNSIIIQRRGIYSFSIFDFELTTQESNEATLLFAVNRGGKFIVISESTPISNYTGGKLSLTTPPQLLDVSEEVLVLFASTTGVSTNVGRNVQLGAIIANTYTEAEAKTLSQASFLVKTTGEYTEEGFLLFDDNTDTAVVGTDNIVAATDYVAKLKTEMVMSVSGSLEIVDNSGTNNPVSMRVELVRFFGGADITANEVIETVNLSFQDLGSYSNGDQIPFTIAFAEFETFPGENYKVRFTDDGGNDEYYYGQGFVKLIPGVTWQGGAT